MEPYFTRVSCEIMYERIPAAIEEDYLGYYESNWDVRTNEFIKSNYKKIQAALKTYPSEYCYYNFHYVSQPTEIELGEEEVGMEAENQRENTSMQEGILYCLLFQDRGKANSKWQRLLVINIEDNTPQAILAAIRYMTRFADRMKNEVKYGSGIIPARYGRQWKVDLAVECKDLYDSAFDWLEGKNEMYFSQTILKYDEDSHRLWFLDNKGEKAKKFLNSDLKAQAFYILVWNHPEEGVKDYDLCVEPSDKAGLVRQKELRAELARYYQIIKIGKLANDPMFYEDAINKFCENRDDRDTARSRIGTAFYKHELERVKGNKLFAKKVREYYAFDATNGTIKVTNRSTTILLPDSLMSDRLKKYNEEHANNADK